MTNKQVDEIVNAIKEDTLYDYIANNYYQFNTYDLKDILLEIIYVTNDYILENEKELIANIKERVCYDD